MEKKRVWALYRVSSAKQMGGKDDIPLQEKEVRKMIAAHTDWVLEKELYERGVSAFKLKAGERDILQEIVKAANKNEFDIFAVFASDRIGRDEDSAVPMVKKLIKKDKVEIWTTTEGQLQFKNHSDKLMINIKFWQNEGESRKISARTTPSVRQNNEEGGFKGGKPPYGFESYLTGEIHPKYKKIKSYFRINEDEARIVRYIFDLADKKGYGCGKIARILNEEGYQNRSGGEFWDNIVNRILNNPMCNGRARYNMFQSIDDGEDQIKVSRDEWKTQPQRQEWIIIDDEQWERVKAMQEARMRTGSKRNSDISVANRGKMLLNGFAYCGYCGHTLHANYSLDYKMVDGEKVKVPKYRYQCLNGKRHPQTHEIKMFTVNKYDPIVEQTVLEFIKAANLDSFADNMTKNHKKEHIKKKKELEKLEDRKKKIEKELEVLNSEVIKILMGEKTKFSEDTLSTIIDQKKTELEKVELEIADYANTLGQSQLELDDTVKLQKELIDWEDRYAKEDLDGKKTMLARIIKGVYLWQNEIKIDFIFVLNQAMKGGVDSSTPPTRLLYKHTLKI